MKTPIIYFETTISENDNNCLLHPCLKYTPLWRIHNRKVQPKMTNKSSIMKNLLPFISMIVFAVAICSCHKGHDRTDVYWHDDIKLSTRTVDFKASGDSVTIKTGGSGWRIGGIMVDTTLYCNFTGVNVLADNFTITQNCFNVERRGKNTLFIKVDANPHSVKRIIAIGLQSFGYQDEVVITQKPK